MTISYFQPLWETEAIMNTNGENGEVERAFYMEFKGTGMYLWFKHLHDLAVVKV